MEDFELDDNTKDKYDFPCGIIDSRGRRLTFENVVDLLNAYAGMKTREEVEDLIEDFKKDVPKDEYGSALFRGHRLAYLNVLNKE